MRNTKSNRIGIAGTLFFHIGIILLLFFLGFHTPLPLPEEEGILINFGNNNQGKGIGYPTPAKSKNQTKPNSSSVKSISKQESKTKSSEQSPKEKITTQSTEEAPVLPSAKEIAKQNSAKDKARKVKAEQDRITKIQKEKQQQLELKRQQEEEIERKRLADIEIKRKKEAERQAKINAINNKAKNIFGRGKDSNSSQGKTFPSGNQGAPNGSNTSNKYEGNGLGNNGYSYDLKGRNSLSIPKPNYNLQESGKVVVEIKVDKNGKVVNARPGMPGSTTSNSTLYEAARKAALKAIFNSDSNAPAYQKGTITYHFQLD